MARQPLPRYRTELVLTLEVAATDELDAERRLAILAASIKPTVERAVGNHRGRTSRVVDGRILTPAKPAKELSR